MLKHKGTKTTKTRSGHHRDTESTERYGLKIRKSDTIAIARMKRKKRDYKPGFEVLPAEEMRRKYGLCAENRPAIKLDPARVPKQLHVMIPLAEKFGVSDDLIRNDLFAKTPRAELEKLKKPIDRFEKTLDKWLAGPEADGPDYSPEYVAFSAMRMGADRFLK